ncbi:MAG: ABC transporter permease subunit [Planctomycetota bacterium]|jgi:ABC-2 type transport system permease protein|nr:ABC transporter permease subunit [Planctomycetota bacterium]
MLTFRIELIKAVFRRRTYIGFGGYCALMSLMYLGMTYSKKPYLTRITKEAGLNLSDFMNGTFFVSMALLPTVNLLYPVFVSLMAGDLLAAETQQGTLRTMLVRPVDRWKVILSKIAVLQIYLLALCAFLALVSMLTGVLCLGSPGDLLIPRQFFNLGPGLYVYELDTALKKLASVYLYVALSGLLLGSIGMFVSLYCESSAAAVITTIVIYFVFNILGSLPPLEEFRPLLFTTHMEAWKLLMTDPVPWGKLTRSITMMLTFAMTFFVLTVLAFTRKDVYC